MRRKFLTTLLTAMIVALSSDGADIITIELCLNETTKKNQELFLELLELDLLMVRSLEIRPCQETAQDQTNYVFRQQLTPLGDNAHSGWQIDSALYAPGKRAIFGQIEFIERPLRKNMVERARGLAIAITQAIDDNITIDDPFSLPTTLSPPSKFALSSPTGHEVVVERPSPNLRSSLGFYLGLERFAQFGFKETLLKSQEIVSTKSAIVVGANFAHHILKALRMGVNVRGGATPLEFIRPLAKEKSQALKITKMLDANVEVAGVVEVTSFLQLHLGVLLSGLFFDSDIKERVPRALLSSFWQLRQGLSGSTTLFLSVFDSTVSVFGAFFPFVQNSQIVMTPFRDFGWRIGLGATSTVYRSLALQFSVDHHREHFFGVVDEQRLRVVSSSVLAYLGIVGKF